MQATVFCAALAYVQIAAHLRSDPEVECDPEFEAMKEIAYDYLLSKWKIVDFQKVSVFFHPKLKKLRMFTEEKNEIMAAIRKEFEMIEKQEEKHQERPSQSETIDAGAKRAKNLVDAFFDGEIDSIANNEIDKYVNAPLVLNENMELEVCLWWHMNREKFPILYKMSKKYLCVPASSSTSERKFSFAKFLVNEKRSRLLPTTVNNVLVLKDA